MCHSLNGQLAAALSSVFRLCLRIDAEKRNAERTKQSLLSPADSLEKMEQHSLKEKPSISNAHLHQQSAFWSIEVTVFTSLSSKKLYNMKP